MGLLQFQQFLPMNTGWSLLAVMPATQQPASRLNGRLLPAFVALIAGVVGGGGMYHVQVRLNPVIPPVIPPEMRALLTDPHARPDAWTRTQAMQLRDELRSDIQRLEGQVGALSAVVQSFNTRGPVEVRAQLGRIEEAVGNIERTLYRHAGTRRDDGAP